MNYESGCKLPCNQLHIDVQTLSKSSYDSRNDLMVLFEDSVKIMEEQSNYNEFDLMVEVGSSLGLWIGLSALGIFDLIFEVVHANWHKILSKVKCCLRSSILEHETIEKYNNKAEILELTNPKIMYWHETECWAKNVGKFEGKQSG